MPERRLETWRYERLYFSGDEYFDAMITAIDSARISIDMEMYIFNADAVGQAVAAALVRAAGRGVRVRLIVDGIGSVSWIGAWRPNFSLSGIAIRVWKPIYVGPFLREVIQHLARGRLWRFLARHNRRTHRKYIVIDGEHAFTGSLNVAAEHSARVRGPAAWRDVGIEVKGQVANKLVQAFNHAWDRSYRLGGTRRWIGRRSLPSLNGASLVRLNFTRAFRRRFRKDLLWRIRRAQKRVWIANAYLVPTAPLLKAIFIASRRGVDVRILLPSRSDLFFMPWVATSFYGALLHAGARIFEYQLSFFHAKTVQIDQWAMIGTSNLNTRSFHHDLEVDIVVTGQETKDQLDAQYQMDLLQSREIDVRALSGRRWIGFLGRIVALLRHWL